MCAGHALMIPQGCVPTVVLANSDLTDKLGVANLASISVRADILSALEVGLSIYSRVGQRFSSRSSRFVIRSVFFNAL